MWASPRVRPWRIRRLYRLAQDGIYDDELLLEVGWGLYARAIDTLTFYRALRGEVPCPQCQSIVYRPKHHRQTKAREAGSTAAPCFPCPSCGQSTSWSDCKSRLAKHPKCPQCWAPLDWRYASNTVSCPRCSREWPWDVFRRSLKGYSRLPCVHCGDVIKRPKREQPKPKQGGVVSDAWGDIACPRCGEVGTHAEGKYRCDACGYERPWRSFVRKLRRETEELACGSCGHGFTWQSWRREHEDPHIRIGNPVGVRDFVAEWTRARTPQTQMIQIDNLLHEIHCRGAMASTFIVGNGQIATELLDELAGI